MRLKESEIKAIKDCSKEVFGECEVRLFGSRMDDNKRGGDIDLYIFLPNPPQFLAKERFLVLLKRKIGEQKIDVVIDYPQKKKRLIDKVGSEGILL
jgi:predicted nucleotidyltransferase